MRKCRSQKTPSHPTRSPKADPNCPNIRDHRAAGATVEKLLKTSLLPLVIPTRTWSVRGLTRDVSLFEL